MESAALPADPSGCLFADWIAAKGIAKSTGYKWRAELGITPEKRRRGAAVEVWLTAEDQQRLEDYAEALGRGLTTRDALAAVGRPAPMDSIGHGAIVPIEPIGPAPADPIEPIGLEQLRWRLAALRDAVELGAPLSTAEVAQLLGARPGGAEVVRGRLRAVRQARNLWTIEPD